MPQPIDVPEWGDDIDKSTFEQILDMDEEDDDEFSRGIVFGFFDQAETTFKEMDKAMQNKDLAELASLGHFLKGSSATLGFTKVKNECEKIQNLGNEKDETGQTPQPDKQKNLQLIKDCIRRAKMNYAIVERYMRRYYAS